MGKLRRLTDKEIKEKGGDCYWWCKAYRHGEGVNDNFCMLAKKDCPIKIKNKGRIK